jgi:tellurite resistance protein
MKTRLTLLAAVTAAVVLLSAAPASAQTDTHALGTKTPGVTAHQANQGQRIDQGVASGQLTARETRRLDRQQQRIAVAKANAKADGSVSEQERKRLHSMQHAASQDIKQQKHDAQTTPAASAKP